MIKFTIIKSAGNTWAFACPLCTFRIPPDLIKSYVRSEVVKHLLDWHSINTDRVKIRVKKLKDGNPKEKT